MAFSDKAETAILLALEALLKDKRDKDSVAAKEAINRVLENRGYRFPKPSNNW